TRGKRLQLSLEWLKKLHQTLLPVGKKDQVQYRKDNPIHRMYFHDLAPADKISYRMRKLTDWFRTEECRKAHPIELAVEVHRELIRIFPWPDISGRVARLAMNAILVAENYWPCILHHNERQTYYDVGGDAERGPEVAPGGAGEHLVAAVADVLEGGRAAARLAEAGLVRDRLAVDRQA